MKKLIFLIAISFNISAATHYVSKAGSNIYPYASWETAAHSINDCVLSGPDDVLVADGTYYESNEIYLAGAMTVKSVNGADKTIVNGSGLHRCFYLTGSTIIDGFTITNGYSGAGSGVYCSSGGTINNCTISGNSATGYGGGTRNGTINNCTISGNSATGYGGGTYNSTIQNCVISGNSADDGGGVYDGTIKNCTISGNSANDGGGAYCSVYGDSTIKNCVISGNSADKGGGVYEVGGTIQNCTIIENTADNYGGGVYEVGGTIQNCTIIENTADNSGGGVYCDNDTRKIYNSIIYYNTAGNYDNIYRGDMKYSCSFPLRTDTGNIFFIPAFIDRAGGDYHLNKSSPCVNSGTNAFAPMPYDLDGNPRIMNGTVDMGAYELVPEPVSNAATHYVSKAGSNIYPYASWETAAHSINDCVLSGPDDVLVADGTYYESNEIYLAGAMTVKSVNGADKTIVNGSGLHRCFYLTGSTIIDGFTITNGYSGAGSGVYCSSGGTINNCTISGNSATGYGGGTRNGTINNCTISGNSATGYGGGTYNSTIQNCVISGNSADDGGGVYDGTIKNCTISGNSANDGGGAYCSVYGDSTIKNCVISGNSADKGGGVYEVGGTIQNCTIIENTADNSGGGVYCDNDTRKIYNSIIYYNTAGNYDNIYRGDMKYSCSFPLRTDTGNIFFIPAFIDRAGGDYHLNKSSPCVNSGTNAFAPMPYDLDGNPRIMNGTVDMGAYELVPEPVSIFYLLLWAVIYFAKRS